MEIVHYIYIGIGTVVTVASVAVMTKDGHDEAEACLMGLLQGAIWPVFVPVGIGLIIGKTWRRHRNRQLSAERLRLQTERDSEWLARSEGQ